MPTAIPTAATSDIWSASTYQGIAVFAVEPATCRHPRYGDSRPVTLKGASLLLLADGVEVVVCNKCGYNVFTGTEPYVKPEGAIPAPQQQANRVTSHMSTTHLRKQPARPLYTDAQIKVIIKVYLKWLAIGKATKLRNFAESAADELNKLHFKPYRAESWNGASVSSAAHSHMGKPQFKGVVAAPLTSDDLRALGVVPDVDSTAPVRETRPSKRSEKSFRRTPIDYDPIIAEAAAAKAAREPLEDEEPMAKPRRDPVFTREDIETPAERVMSVAPRMPGDKVIGGAANAPAVANPVVWEQPSRLLLGLPEVEVVQPDFQLITEQDGEPVFLYKGKLMVGKTVKSFSV